MLIPVPAKESYNVEPGRYRAICTEIRELEGTEKSLRIIWDLDIPGSGNVLYRAGKNYEPSLAKNSRLRNALITWFGHDIKVRQFDTATLKGKKAIVTIQHIENEGWDNPYCEVCRIEPVTEVDADDERIISANVVCG